MKTLFYPLLCLLPLGCSTLSLSSENRAPASSAPKVTLETSGDIYPNSDGSQIQMDFFGSCAKGESHIFLKVKNKPIFINCQDGNYKYSHFFAKSIYSSATKAHHLLKIHAYHKSQESSGARSWVLLDLKNQVVKTVLNKQIRFEKIPTGELEPVTEFNAFGTCTSGIQVKIDITDRDRYGKRVSRYDDQKPCKNSGFYFLSQIDGLSSRGMRFEISESGLGETKVEGRSLASEGQSAALPPPSFRWSTDMN